MALMTPFPSWGEVMFTLKEVMETEILYAILDTIALIVGVILLATQYDWATCISIGLFVHVIRKR